MLKTYEIKCRFCGIKNGEIEVPDNYSFDPLTEIADSRCDLHEQQFGNYKEMENEYKMKIKKGDFKKIMEKSEFKKNNFDIELKKEIKNVII